MSSSNVAKTKRVEVPTATVAGTTLGNAVLMLYWVGLLKRRLR